MFNYRLIFIFSLLCIFLTAACSSINKIRGAEDANVVREIRKIGNYSIRPEKIAFKVNNLKTLFAALENCNRGDVIFINENVKIDLTDQPTLIIPGGVSLLSSGKDDRCATLFTTNIGHNPLIKVSGDNVRIMGLKIIGPDPLRRIKKMRELIAKDQYYSLPYSYGIICDGYNNLQVGHCDISGWSYAAISLRRSFGNLVHHSNIHHNQRLGLGYGILLDEADVIAEYNYFNYNRHSVAGSGRLNTSYTVRFNVFGNKSLDYVLDMHEIKDETLKRKIAGSRIEIYNNTFYTTENGSIVIHGNPLNEIVIANNIFWSALEPERMILLKSASARTAIDNNILKINQAELHNKMVNGKEFVLTFRDSIQLNTKPLLRLLD